MKINAIFGWWGDLLGTTDNALSLLDYFDEKQNERFILNEVLKELHLTDSLKNHTLKNDSANPFYFVDINMTTVDFNIGIDLLLNLAYILAEANKSNGLSLNELNNRYSKKRINFDYKSEDIYMICDELELFYDDPESYNIAELVDKDTLYQMAEISHDLIEQLL